MLWLEKQLRLAQRKNRAFGLRRTFLLASTLVPHFLGRMSAPPGNQRCFSRPINWPQSWKTIRMW